MALEIKNRSEGKPMRLPVAKVAHAECDAAEARPPEMGSCQGGPTPAEIRAGNWSPKQTTPSSPKADETGEESMPESFDALEARIDKRFEKLLADFEQMRRDLAEAEERSEGLRHKLFDDGELNGFADDGSIASIP